MTKREIFIKGHELAKKLVKLIGNYRAAFSAALKKIYAGIKAAAETKKHDVIITIDGEGTREEATFLNDPAAANKEFNKRIPAAGRQGYNKTWVTIKTIVPFGICAGQKMDQEFRIDILAGDYGLKETLLKQEKYKIESLKKDPRPLKWMFKDADPKEAMQWLNERYELLEKIL